MLNEDKKLIVEIQYFENCPNFNSAITNVKKALEKFKGKATLKENIINTNELAEKFSFRGSPTILINGNDIENLPSPEKPSLTCRVYKNGIPDVTLIEKTILQELINFY